MVRFRIVIYGVLYSCCIGFFGKGKSSEGVGKEEPLVEAFGYRTSINPSPSVISSAHKVLVPGREVVKSSFPFDVKVKHPELAARSTFRDEFRLYEEIAQHRVRLSEKDDKRARQISDVKFGTYSCDDLISRTYPNEGVGTQPKLRSKAYDDVTKTSWGMSSGNSGANIPWAISELVGEGDYRVSKDLSLEEKKAVLQERHGKFLPLIIQWMPNTKVPGHDFIYEELAGPIKMDSARRMPESDGLASRSGRNLRVHFASPEQVSSSALRSSHIHEDDTAGSGSVSVAVSSEASSVFDQSISGDVDEYESDEYTDPPSSIMVEQPERPSHTNALSLKRGKRPVQVPKIRSRSFLLGASRAKPARTVSDIQLQKSSSKGKTGSFAPSR
jgi:hypothetical protein